MKRLSTFFFFLILAVTFCAHALTDPRRKMPAAFKESYIGLTAGWINIPFTNNNLENGLTANSIQSPHLAAKIFIGHYFNPHLGVQLSLMRPFDWVHFEGITYSKNRHSVWISLFGITLRPTLFLSHHVSAYGNIGLGFISRHGFQTENNIVAVKHDFITTALIGGGLAYAFNQHWHYDVGFSFTPENHHEKQPSITYIYTGFYYVLIPGNSTDDSTTNNYFFPLNFIQVGFFTDKLFHENANKYVSEGYLPIFWDGKVKNSNGVYFMYERNFFHTDRTFSLEWGASIARYQTQQYGQVFYTFSLFPALKVWLLRSKNIDFYFTYSVAGPTYMTRDYLDHTDTGTHFIFQDFMGFGLFLGKKKCVNLNVKIGHYSNGNIFPMNAGIEVPLTIALGFTF